MTTMERQRETPHGGAQRTPRSSWVPLIASAVLTTILLGVSGFLFGTMQGDIPWPATRAEETVYYTARGLEWAALAIPFLGAIAVAVVRPTRTGGSRWLWALVTLIGSGILGAVAFFSAYFFAQANYLFALTS